MTLSAGRMAAAPTGRRLLSAAPSLFPAGHSPSHLRTLPAGTGCELGPRDEAPLVPHMGLVIES